MRWLPNAWNRRTLIAIISVKWLASTLRFLLRQQTGLGEIIFLPSCSRKNVKIPYYVARRFGNIKKFTLKKAMLGYYFNLDVVQDAERKAQVSTMSSLTNTTPTHKISTRTQGSETNARWINNKVIQHFRIHFLTSDFFCGSSTKRYRC